ncbi:MAG: SWIM zinc finger family protein [Myxococcota bacterium]
MSSRVVTLRYPTPSEVESTPKASRLRLSLDVPLGAGGSTIGFSGRVANAELFRDALLTAIDLRNSDLRYRGRDRTAYLAFLMKKGKKATAAVWEAQKAFLDAQYSEERTRPRGLDPIVTVDPDELSLEVFSRDESAYARLAFANDGFEGRAVAHGSAACDLPDAVVDRIQRLRTYQPLDLELGTALAGSPAPREIELPDDWLRGFLQVQSAATLPASVVSLGAIDLYDVLYVLRTRKAKQAPRALRFELVPGRRPRIVLEPWEIAIEGHGDVYRGSTPRVARTFGRQRLLALARALPHVKSARVHLLGAGLPSFWVLDLGAARMTVALTSWSESKWAGAASFDALIPTAADGGVDRVKLAIDALRTRGPLPLSALSETVGAPTAETRTALQRACLRGQALFDVDRQVYRPRALLAQPVDEAAIRYGSPREELAHRLLGGGAEIRVTKIHLVVGEGQQVEGEVVDRQLQRTFSPRFAVDVEGQVGDAWCNCATYLRSGLREGPCEHMIALFVHQRREAAEAERIRATPEGRRTIRAETRTLHRRDADGAQTSFRVSLDDRAVRIAKQQADPGQPFGEIRHQRTWFDSDVEAREAYFARLDSLAASGFIDTDAAAV